MSALKPISLQDQAYYKLREAIIFASYKPGERLNPKDVCEDLELGRTPVREAIVRLQQEGLVKTIPQSGTFVSKVDSHAAENARFSRECLEKQVVIECCATLNTDAIKRLDEIIKQQEDALASHDEYAFFVSDNRMHEAFFEMADRHEVWDWLSLTNAHFERFRWLSAITKGVSWNVVMAQHRQLCDAIARHDPNEAAYLITMHLHKASSDLQEVVAAHPEYFEESVA